MAPPAADRERRGEQAKVGMTEEGIRTALGDPQREYTKDNAPRDYYERGYRHVTRAITGKALIYFRGDAICYVYLDESGQVEAVFVGAS